jgi:hypothetical protein
VGPVGFNEGGIFRISGKFEEDVRLTDVVTPVRIAERYILQFGRAAEEADGIQVGTSVESGAPDDGDGGGEVDRGERSATVESPPTDGVEGAGEVVEGAGERCAGIESFVADTEEARRKYDISEGGGRLKDGIGDTFKQGTCSEVNGFKSALLKDTHTRGS